MINLENELHNRPGKAVLEEVGTLKDKLEIKLAELGGLVFDLGRAQKSGTAASSPSRRRSRRASTKRSPDQRNWRNALTLSEVAGGQDGRLPPIVEDKYFPRRTLEYVLKFCVTDNFANDSQSRRHTRYPLRSGQL